MSEQASEGLILYLDDLSFDHCEVSRYWVKGHGSGEHNPVTHAVICYWFICRFLDVLVFLFIYILFILCIFILLRYVVLVHVFMPLTS